MEKTANMELPYLMAAQAQKHITHNEALRALDAIVQLSVMDRDMALPPTSPNNGERYIVAASASGVWFDKDGQIAAWQDNAWMFYAPVKGWLAWVQDEDKLLAFDGVTWRQVSSDVGANTALLIGINTTASAPDRLAVKSDTILFSHDDVTPGNGDIQTKLNKADVGNTASFLFQDDYSGRAEIGLIGDDDFHFKVSADGTSWSNAITFQATTGNIGFNTAPQSGNGRCKIDGALQVTRENNAFGTSSSYTALVVGAPGSTGGLYAIGRADANHAPYCGLSGWDSGSRRWLYYGGGGWGVPSATIHAFYTAPTYDENNDTGLSRLEIWDDGHTRPGADNAYDLGASGRRWANIYSANGIINTSDNRLKTDIAPSDLGLDFINKLKPVSYRWKSALNKPVLEYDDKKDGQERTKEVVETQKGKRTHYGLLSQDVQEALQNSGCTDFAGWILADKSDPDSQQGLRYTELIAPLIKAVQELSQQVEYLK